MSADPTSFSRDPITFVFDDGGEVEGRPLYYTGRASKGLDVEYYTTQRVRISCVDKIAGDFIMEGDDRTLRIKR
jgi:hypothetical protein